MEAIPPGILNKRRGILTILAFLLYCSVRGSLDKCCSAMSCRSVSVEDPSTKATFNIHRSPILQKCLHWAKAEIDSAGSFIIGIIMVAHYQAR